MRLEGMRLIPWDQRQLAFGRGLEELPLLLERMRGTPARLASLIRHHPLERLLLRRQGNWSAMEHIAHLLLLDQRLQERVDDFVNRRPKLCAIDLGDQAEVLARHRHRAPGDLLEEFRLSRTLLVARFWDMEEASLRHQAQHPCRGIRMSPADMALYVAEHDDHHLVRIRGLLGAFPD